LKLETWTGQFLYIFGELQGSDMKGQGIINLNCKLKMNICLSIAIFGALLEKSILLIRAGTFDKLILGRDANTTFWLRNLF
jgi:hypothetical protein